MSYVKDYQYTNTTVSEAVVSRAYRDMYGWMACGLALSAITAFFCIDKNIVIAMMQSNVMWLLAIASFVMVFVLNAAIQRISFTTATLCFAGYSIIMGAWIAPVLYIYTAASVFQVFASTAAAFGAMALYGHFTKRDLSSFGRIFMMGLIGIIIASVINIFVANSVMDFVVSILGVVLFCGLTMYDVQQFKQMLNQSYLYDNQTVQKIALLGALKLYLDFLNLFLYLLRLLGDRRD
ncbi:MAG: Bax inhibitor-1/YccA family protein [Bacteroidales bacterium]|nr:Bax inhibitor-1/YccA family protein [Bacteroidales bacterium]